MAADSRPVVVRSLAEGGNCIYVNSLVHNENCDWLVDTGASVCLLHYAVFDAIPMDVRPPLTRCGVECLAADGKTTLDVSGRALVDVSMGDRTFSIPVIVADLGHIDAIMGVSFIRQWQLTIDPSASVLRSYIHGFEIPTFDQNSSQCYRVVVQESCLLECDKEQIVLARVERHKDFVEPFVADEEPTISFCQTGVLLSHALVRGPL